jgi:hypothetical protein
MPRGANSKNAARRNRVPPAPVPEADRMITLFVWHVSRGHPDITTIRIAYDAPLEALRHAICLYEGYRGPVTLLDDARQLNDDARRLVDYDLNDGDIVRVVDNSAAASSTGRA